MRIVNLLVIDRSLSDIERIAQSLRSAGHVIQALHAERIEQIRAIRAEKPPDLVLVRQDEGLPSVAEVHAELQAASLNVPLIAIVDARLWQHPVELLRAGADNLCRLDDPDHLIAVAGRELRELEVRRQTQVWRKALAESEARFRTLLDSSRDAIAYTHEGAHVFANRAYLELFGYASEQALEGITLMDLVPSGDRDKLKGFLRQASREDGRPEPVELTGLHSDGRRFPIRIEATPARVRDEPCLQLVVRRPGPQAQVQPPSEALQPQIEALRRQDVLTGLYNRTYFTEYLNRLLGAGNPEGAVLYILLSEVRTIWERHGLEVVEQLTIDLAQLLKGLVAEHDVLARFADGVFTVYTPVSDRNAVLALGERISKAIKNHVSHAAHTLVATASCTGICMLRQDHESAGQILTEADRACETACQTGGSQVKIYRPAVAAAGERDNIYLEQIRDAINQERLTLLFQPIASLLGDATERYEGYLHVLGENGNPLPMDELAAVAERRGLLYTLDKWAITRALTVLTAHRQQSRRATCLFIPLSSNSVTASDLAEWLGHVLQGSGLSGEALVFEVTEECAEFSIKEAEALREALRGLGCGFALSHFGSRLHSERLLKHLAPDYVKLSGALLERVARGRDEDREAVDRLTEQAREINSLLVADEVASAPQMAAAWQLGVALVQGNMVQPPGPQLDFDFKLFGG